jgi:hypothetical protein
LVIWTLFGICHLNFGINKPVQVLLLIIAVAFLPFFCSAAQSLDVVINEIVWMGTDVSANDEWIELYNNTDLEIDLGGWKLIAQDETPQISLTGKIAPQDFFILERTDDETISAIKANQIYKGALNNKGEFLKLINGNQVVDEVDCRDGWFKGNNQTKQTMERLNTKLAGNNQNNWQTSQESGGTPKAQNFLKVKAESQPETGGIKEEKNSSTDYPGRIVINELLPSPQGADAENEYIEIFNQNDFSLDISGYSFQDTEGQTKIFTFPTQTIIEMKEFLVFFRLQTKITLNNSGDGLKLYNPGKELIDEIHYDKAEEAKSFNRVDDVWFWSAKLTPGTENVILQTKEEMTQNQGENEDKEKQKKSLHIKEEELLGTMSDILSSRPSVIKNFFSVLSIGLITAFLSGIVILTLKKKLKSRQAG